VNKNESILVIEDEPSVMALVRSALERCGYPVVPANSGVDGLRLLAAASYRGVISDMRMPGLDGPTLYRQIVARHPHLEKRFVFLTGDTFRPETQQFFKETQTVYLIKPCTSDEIAAAVQQVFR